MEMMAVLLDQRGGLIPLPICLGSNELLLQYTTGYFSSGMSNLCIACLIT